MGPKFHCRVYKRLSPLPVLREINPVHATYPSHFLKIHLNIILSFTPGSSKLPLFLPKPYRTSPFPHTCHMPRPLHCSGFFHPNNIRRELWSLSSHYIIFSTPLLLCPLRPKYSPQHPILKHPQPTFLTQCQWPCFTPIKNNNNTHHITQPKHRAWSVSLSAVLKMIASCPLHVSTLSTLALNTLIRSPCGSDCTLHWRSFQFL